MNTGFDLIFGRSLECFGKNLVFAFVRQLYGWKSMIIQTRLADGNDTRISGKFTQWRDHIFTGFFDISWMNADNGKNVRILFGKIDSAPAAFNRRADSNDARDSGLVGALENVIKVRREIRIIEVGVSFDQHFRIPNALPP